MIQPLADLWDQRSPREQRLGLATLILCLALLILFGIQQARFTLTRLDRDIDRLSNDLVNYHYQIARRQSVEARFARVASQHSSAWTESEIRDRLRQEIYRLANRMPPGLDANGIPLSTTAEGGALVTIPRLGQGHLEDGDQGYREYRISVHIPPTPVDDMVAYLERLQRSPQSLRIDRIDMRRDASGSAVRADVDITRIVVDTDVDDLAGAPLAAAGSQTGLKANVVDWTAKGCTVSLFGDSALRLQSESPTGSAWVDRSLPMNTTFDAEIILRSTGPAQVSISLGDRAMDEEHVVTVDEKDGMQRVTFRFTTPVGSGEESRVRLPFLQLEGQGTEVLVDRIALRQVTSP